MRGYKQPAHCACGEPHASDHSSPAHRQSYDASQALLFSASVGIRLSTRGKGVLPNRTRGVPDFAEEVTGEPQQWLGKKLAIAGCYRKRIARFTRRVRPPHISISCCQSRLLRAKRETSRAATAPTLPRHTSAHHRLNRRFYSDPYLQKRSALRMSGPGRVQAHTLPSLADDGARDRALFHGDQNLATVRASMLSHSASVGEFRDERGTPPSAKGPAVGSGRRARARSRARDRLRCGSIPSQAQSFSAWR